MSKKEDEPVEEPQVENDEGEESDEYEVEVIPISPISVTMIAYKVPAATSSLHPIDLNLTVYASGVRTCDYRRKRSTRRVDLRRMTRERETRRPRW